MSNDKELKEKIVGKHESASRLLKKFKGDSEIQSIIKAYYGSDVSVMTYEYGWLHFSHESMQNIVGGENLTYDDYLELQIRSYGKTRTSFEQCYYEIGLEYCGQIEKKTKNAVCFKRILVRGMYSDGIMFDGKEDHVWLALKGFEAFEVGDSVSFVAEVYRYIKTGNGKVLDYGLREPKSIRKIDPYRLPSDDELKVQVMSLLQCELCYLNEHCNRIYCMLNASKRK